MLIFILNYFRHDKEMDAKFMDKRLYIGFKGKNNASSILVRHLSENSYLLTNSFAGVRNDMEHLADCYDYVLMFGIDKNLKNTVRIERVAEREDVRLLTDLDVDTIAKSLKEAGVANYISDTPTQYLCNEAYWFSLRKFKGKVVFLHIPSLRNVDESFFEKMKAALSRF